VSQTMISTEDDAKRRRNGEFRPPNSAVDLLDRARGEDQNVLAARPNTKDDGSEGIRDKVRLGFGMGDNVDGFHGVYADYMRQANPVNPGDINQLIARDTQISRDLGARRLRGSAERGGGLLYWLSRRGKRTAQQGPRPQPPTT
jgi:hypothetical protein